MEPTQRNHLLLELFNSPYQSGDYQTLLRLNRLTEEIKELESNVVIPELISYLKNKQYTIENRLDQKLLHVIRILRHFKDPGSLPYLIELTEDEKVFPFLEDLISCIGQFNSEKTRSFLIKQLKKKNVAYRSAIVLANFHDASGESTLIDSLIQSCEKRNFLDEIAFALIKLRNNQVWTIIDQYLKLELPERERYKVCTTLLSLDHSRIIPLLINCYDYYNNNKKIDYQEVKSISLEDTKMTFGRANKQLISFSDKIKQKIADKLKTYQSDFKVKTWLRGIENQNKKSFRSF